MNVQFLTDKKEQISKIQVIIQQYKQDFERLVSLKDENFIFMDLSGLEAKWSDSKKGVVVRLNDQEVAIIKP